MKFYSKVIDKLRVNMKHLYDLLLDSFKHNCNNELETLFQQIKTFFAKDVTPTLPSTNHTFLTTVDSSLTGIGCVLLAWNDKRKLVIIAFNF